MSDNVFQLFKNVKEKLEGGSENTIGATPKTKGHILETENNEMREKVTDFLAKIEESKESFYTLSVYDKQELFNVLADFNTKICKMYMDLRKSSTDLVLRREQTKHLNEGE